MFDFCIPLFLFTFRYTRQTVNVRTQEILLINHNLFLSQQIKGYAVVAFKDEDDAVALVSAVKM